MPRCIDGRHGRVFAIALLAAISLLPSHRIVAAQDRPAPPMLTVDEALDLARQWNPRVRMAVLQAQVAENDHAWGTVGYLPSVQFSVQQAKRTFGAGIGGVGISDLGTLDVVSTVGYTVFDGFRRGAAYRRLGEVADRTDIEAGQVLEATLRNVATLYFDIARQQQQLSALEEAIEISDDRLRIAELRLGIGSASELEVRRAQVDGNADRAALLRQEFALEQSKAALNALLGRERAPDFRVTDSIPVDASLDLDALSDRALRANRELLAAVHNETAAEYERRTISRERSPTLAAQLGYAANDVADELGFAPFRPTGLLYGASLQLNVFNGRNLNRRIENARLRQRMASLAVEETRASLLTQLAAGHKNYLGRIRLLALEEENTAIARDNVEIALERFRLGLSTSLELREVQNALTSARSRLALARFEAKRAEIELLQLSGLLLR